MADYRGEEYAPLTHRLTFDHVAIVPVRTSKVPPEFWLEAPTNDLVVIYGQDAVMAHRPQEKD